jgi:hypothetical protein
MSVMKFDDNSKKSGVNPNASDPEVPYSETFRIVLEFDETNR